MARDWCLGRLLWIPTSAWGKALHYRQSWTLLRVKQAHITVVELHYFCLASVEKTAYLDLFFSFLAFFGEGMIYCLQSTKTYCQSHKLPVCPNQERSFVVQGDREPLIFMGSPLEEEWGFFNCYDYFKKQQKFKKNYFKNLTQKLDCCFAKSSESSWKKSKLSWACKTLPAPSTPFIYLFLGAS